MIEQFLQFLADSPALSFLAGGFTFYALDALLRRLFPYYFGR